MDARGRPVPLSILPTIRCSARGTSDSSSSSRHAGAEAVDGYVESHPVEPLEGIGFLHRHQRRVRKIGARSSNPRRCGKALSSPARQPRTVLKRTNHDLKPMATTTSNIPTRGRKRFLFDLRNASQTAEQGVEVQGLRIFSTPLLSSLH